MATMGPTTQRAVEHFAANLLKLARMERGWSQRDLARQSGVPQSTIAEIETSARQPSWPLLCRLLAAADLEPRVHLEPYDNHDDVLDASDARLAAEARAVKTEQLDDFLAGLRAAAVAADVPGAVR